MTCPRSSCALETEQELGRGSLSLLGGKKSRLVTEEKQVSSNLALKSLSSLLQRRGRHGKIEGRGSGRLPQFPRRKRPSSPATAQAPPPHSRPVVPVPPCPTPARESGERPHRITPSLTRTRTSNAMFLDNHFRVKDGLPESPRPPPLHEAVFSPVGARQPQRRRTEAAGSTSARSPPVHGKVGPGRAAGQPERERAPPTLPSLGQERHRGPCRLHSTSPL